MKSLKTKKNVKQAVRFGVVGLFNTIVDYGVFYILISAVNVHKSIAQVLSTAASMCGSFFINRYWTFEKSGRSSAGEMTKFIAVNLVSMFSVIFFTHLFYDIFHIEQMANTILKTAEIPYILEGDTAVMLAKFVSSVFSVIINFLGNKLWVFRNK